VARYGFVVDVWAWSGKLSARMATSEMRFAQFGGAGFIEILRCR
jgi:hypothetical protein